MEVSARFASATESDIASLLNNENTNKLAVVIFQVYLQEKGQPIDFVSLPVANLRDLLKKLGKEEGQRGVLQVNSYYYEVWSMSLHKK